MPLMQEIGRYAARRLMRPSWHRPRNDGPMPAAGMVSVLVYLDPLPAITFDDVGGF